MGPNHVRAPENPDWGPGVLLRPAAGGLLDAFFLRSGRRHVDTRKVRVIFGTKVLKREVEIFDAANAADWTQAKDNVYVVALLPGVLELKGVAETNPAQLPEHDRCVYVGLTGLTPEERLEYHRKR